MHIQSVMPQDGDYVMVTTKTGEELICQCHIDDAGIYHFGHYTGIEIAAWAPGLPPYGKPMFSENLKFKDLMR